MDTPKIVIVGSSYSSASVFYYLQKCLSRTREPIDLLLLTNRSYYFLENQLCHLLSNSCDLSDLSQEFREIGYHSPGVSFLETRDHIEIDFNKKIIRTKRGEINYEYLVLAPENDVVENELNTPDSNCFILKTPLDIIKLKNHIINNLQNSLYEKDNEIKKASLAFSVIGAKKAGVEIASSLTDFINNLLRHKFVEYKRSLFSINLIEEENNIIDKEPFYNNRILYNLNKKGINLHTKSKVTKLSKNKITINSDKEIASGTIILTNNIEYSSLIRELPLEKDNELKAYIDLYMQAKGYENVYVIGEATKCLDLSEDTILTVPLLKKQAKICACNILAKINNIPPRPFTIPVSMDFISLGSRNSLLEIKGVYFDGIIAYMVHRTIFALQFPGLLKKIRTLISTILGIVGLKEYLVIDFKESVKERQTTKV